MIIAVTGHRPPKLGGYRTPNPIYRAVRNAITEYLQEQQAEIIETPDTLVVLSGMALGVDQWTADICNEWGIPWDAIIPFRGFEGRWPDDAQRRYHQLLETARTTHFVADTYEYKAAHLYRRNAWMVDHSDHVLAIWNGSPGGTANCVEYARRRGKRVENLQLPIEIWDQARDFEQRTAGRRTQLNINNQYLTGIYPPSAQEPLTREYVELTNRQRAQHVDAINSLNLNNDAFYNNQEEAPATVPHMTSSGSLVERLLETGQSRPFAPSAAQAAMQQRVAEEQLVAIRRRIEESMLGHIGHPVTPESIEAVNRQLAATLEEINRTGVIHGNIHVSLPNPVQYVGLDFAVPGTDQTVVQVSQVVQEEPVKEIISPEKRFLPGRIIDIED